MPSAFVLGGGTGGGQIEDLRLVKPYFNKRQERLKYEYKLTLLRVIRLFNLLRTSVQSIICSIIWMGIEP